MSQPLVSRTCSIMHRPAQPSTALHFLTQCRRSLTTTRRPSATQDVLPDFLIPSYRMPLTSRSPAHSLRRPSRRPFSSTPHPRQTSVLLNPRTDDSGDPMTIDISPRAAQRLSQITSSSSPSTSTLSHLGSLGPRPSAPSSSDHLRVSVTSGGCHGFQYLMSLEPADKIVDDEDTVFVAQHGDAEVALDDGGKAVVVMDEPSLELLRGSTIDYTMELIGSQFKVVGNPRAKSSCGCGTSFDVAG